MQYKCRPFFVFMGKTEEFCCPEIQTHILHDKMIMKKEKTYSRAPLPFVGQKRMFVSEFKKILKHFDDKTIFVDLFGGSGSTLITCEQTDRICCTIELDEKFCDVIIRRYIEQVGTDEKVSVLRDGKEYKLNEVCDGAE